MMRRHLRVRSGRRHTARVTRTVLQAVGTLALLMSRTGSAEAGIPCLVSEEGIPLRWDPMPIVYNLDPGPLASHPHDVIGAEDGADLVRQAAAAWEDVGTAAVRFAAGPTLPADVTADKRLRCGSGLGHVRGSSGERVALPY